MEPDHPASGRAIAALAFGTLAIGTAELMAVGVLELVSEDLSVSAGTSGLLVTAYALSIAIGGPLATAATLRLARKPVLCAALTLFAAANLVAALAGDFVVLVAARGVSGALHGLFIGVAFTVAAALVTPERGGHAASVILGGIVASTLFGVPLGALIGELLGWRSAFGLVITLTAIALAGVVAFVPPSPAQPASRLRAQASDVLNAPMLAVMGTGFLVIGGQFVVLTYVTTLLAEVTSVRGTLISAFLLLYGVAGTLGTIAGGRAADRGAAVTVLGASVAVVASLALLSAGSASPGLTAAGLAAVGLSAWALLPALQLCAAQVSGAGRDLAASLVPSAVTAGIAAGAVLGGVIVEHAGPRWVAPAGTLACVAALPLAWALLSSRPTESRRG